jgi:uncharacterized protein (TIGR04222 family)
VLAYLIAVAVFAVGGLVVRQRTVGGRVRGAVPVVDQYLTALLAGGRRRVAMTVLSEMVDEGQVVVDNGGRASVVVGVDTITDPMCHAVVRSFRGRQQVRAGVLLGRAARAPEMLGPRKSAWQQGLLYVPVERRRAIVSPLPIMLAAIGGFRFVVVEFVGTPVVIAVAVLVVVLVGGVGLMVTAPRGTPLGRAAVRETAGTHGYGVAVRAGRAVRDPNLRRAL